MSTEPSTSDVAKPPRKKACHHCSQAKVRCSLDKPTCTRCRVRTLSCIYPDSEARHESIETSPRHNQTLTSTPSETLSYVSVSPNIEIESNSGLSTSSFSQSIHGNDLQTRQFSTTLGNQPLIRRVGGGNPDFSDLSDLRLGDVDLVCTVDPQMVRNRWIDRLMSSSDSRLKHLAPLTIHLTTSALKTYPKMCLQEDGLPPIIHKAQIVGSNVPEALANCFNIARLMDSQVLGSETLMREILEKEMTRIIQNVSIGTIHCFPLFSRFKPNAPPSDSRHAMAVNAGNVAMNSWPMVSVPAGDQIGMGRIASACLTCTAQVILKSCSKVLRIHMTMQLFLTMSRHISLP
jgi:hypothetical protein